MSWYFHSRHAKKQLFAFELCCDQHFQLALASSSIEEIANDCEQVTIGPGIAVNAEEVPLHVVLGALGLDERSLASDLIEAHCGTTATVSVYPAQRKYRSAELRDICKQFEQLSF